MGLIYHFYSNSKSLWDPNTNPLREKVYVITNNLGLLPQGIFWDTFSAGWVSYQPEISPRVSELGCRHLEQHFPVFSLLCQRPPIGAPAHISRFQLKEYLNLKSDMSEVVANFLHCYKWTLHFFVSQNIQISSCILLLLRNCLVITVLRLFL